MSYTYYKEEIPPTAVHGCVVARFIDPNHTNLVVSKANVLDVYSVRKTKTGDFVLQLSLSRALFGRIESLHSLRLTGSSTDALILSFKDAKISIVEYDTDTNDIKVISLHYFEFDELKGGQFSHNLSALLVLDKVNRCSAMVAYDDNLVILPFRQNSGFLDAMDVGFGPQHSVMPSHLIRLSSMGIYNVKDMTFLRGYFEPTLLILHETRQSWAGRYDVEKRTCSVSAISLSLSQDTYPIIWSIDGLPHSCFKLFTVPSSAGGAVVLDSNMLLYVSQTTRFGVSLNEFGDGEDISGVRMSRSSIPAIQLCGACGTFLTENELMLSLDDGELYIFRLAIDLSTMVVLRAGSSVQTATMAAFTSYRTNFVFLGSVVADSLLVRYRAEAMGHAVGTRRVVDDEDELYAEDQGIFGVAASSEARSYKFKYCDSLINVGPVVDMCVGDSLENLQPGRRAGSKQLLEFVACVGCGRDGALVRLQRGVRWDVRSEHMLPGWRAIWTAHSDALEGLEDHEEDAGEDQGEKDPTHHSLVVLTSSTRTMVLKAGDSLKEITGQTCMGGGPTLSIGNMFGDKRIVQVHPGGVRVISGVRVVAHVDLGAHEVIHVSSMLHPYVVVGLTSGELVVFRVEMDSIEQVARVREDVQAVCLCAGDNLVGLHQDDVEEAETASGAGADALARDDAEAAGLYGDEDEALYAGDGDVEREEAMDEAVGGEDSVPRGHEDDATMAMEDLYGEDQHSDDGGDVRAGGAGSMGASGMEEDDAAMMEDLYGDDDDDDDDDDADVDVEQDASLRHGDQGEAVGEEQGQGEVEDVEDEVVVPSVAEHEAEMARRMPQHVLLGCVTPNGHLELFSLPHMKKIFTCGGLVDGRRVLVNDPDGDEEAGEAGEAGEGGDERKPHVADGSEDAVRPKVVEVMIRRLGNVAHSLPYVLALLDDGSLVVYRCFRHHPQGEQIKRNALLSARGLLTIRWARHARTHVPHASGAAHGTRMGSSKRSASGERKPMEPVSSHHEAYAYPRMRHFHDVGGREGVFIMGSRPVWVFAQRDFVRVYPADQHAMGTTVACFSEFHGAGAHHGFLHHGEDQVLRISEVGEGTTLTLPWVVRKSGARGTPTMVRYHHRAKVYCLGLAVPRERVLLSGGSPSSPSSPSSSSPQGVGERTLPLVDAVHQVQLVTANTDASVASDWLYGDRYELGDGEHLLSMAVLRLFNRKARRWGTYLVVGTGVVQGEDEATHGRILVFDVLYYTQNWGNIRSGGEGSVPRLRHLFTKDERGPITMVTAMKGKLVVSVGPKVLGYHFEGSDVVGCAFYDAQVYTSRAITLKNLMLCADAYQGVALLHWRDHGLRITRLAGSLQRMEAYAAQFVVRGPAVAVVASDGRGNVHTWAYDPRSVPTHGTGSSLAPKADFHTASPIHAFVRMPMVEDAGGGHTTHAVWFGSTSGSVGFVAPIDGGAFRRLAFLQNRLYMAVEHAAGLNPRTFRLHRADAPMQRNNKLAMVDGELLEEFRRQDTPKQRWLASSIGTTVEKLTADLDSIRAAVSQVL